MDELLRGTGSGAIQHPALHQGPYGHPAQQHALFRSVSSSLQHQHSDVVDAQSEGSEGCCTSNASPVSRIKTAKAILALAAASYPPALPRPGHSRGAGVAPGSNTGALGSLLAMIQSPRETEATRHDALETLNFMLLDRANRGAIIEGGGLDSLMDVLQGSSSPAVRCAALEAVATLVKGDNKLKERVWSHPGRQGIFSLVSLSLPAAQLSEVLCHLRKLAFSTVSGFTNRTMPNYSTSRQLSAPPYHPSLQHLHPPSQPSPTSHGPRHTSSAVHQQQQQEDQPADLLDPGVLAAVANVLVPSLPYSPMSKALRLLRMAAESASHAHLSAWNSVAFRLVPLLRSPACAEAVLGVMLPLAEHTWCRNAFMAAGAIPPLLSLLTSATHPGGAAVNAACVLSCLCDGPGLSRDMLTQEGPLAALLRALNATTQPEVAIAITYTLNRLALARPSAAAALRARGAPSILSELMSGGGSSGAGDSSASGAESAAGGSHNLPAMQQQGKPATPGRSRASAEMWAGDSDLVMGAQQLLDTLATADTQSPLGYHASAPATAVPSAAAPASPILPAVPVHIASAMTSVADSVAESSDRTTPMSASTVIVDCSSSGATPTPPLSATLLQTQLRQAAAVAPPSPFSAVATAGTSRPASRQEGAANCVPCYAPLSPSPAPSADDALHGRASPSPAAIAGATAAGLQAGCIIAGPQHCALPSGHSMNDPLTSISSPLLSLPFANSEMLPVGYLLPAASCSLRVDPNAPRTGDAVFQPSSSADMATLVIPLTPCKSPGRCSRRNPSRMCPACLASHGGSSSGVLPATAVRANTIGATGTHGRAGSILTAYLAQSGKAGEEPYVSCISEAGSNSRGSSRESIDLSAAQLGMLPIAASVGGNGRLGPSAQVVERDRDSRGSPRSREAGVHNVIGGFSREPVLLQSSTRALSMGAERGVSVTLAECGVINNKHPAVAAGRGPVNSAGQLGFPSGETRPMVLGQRHGGRPGAAAGAGGHNLRPDPLLAAAAAATASAAAMGAGVAGPSLQLQPLAH